ncbi:MAG: hypothetical protein AWM53_02003 [Candidatus Dichloromethanomonas elyunquensis]|nr:MAG: hypothetical protein AWM53_02003 [Candidatus Dichloromethanomonas elyunquensis]
MLNYCISQSQLAKLDEKYKMTDSEIRSIVKYGIPREGDCYLILEAQSKRTDEIFIHKDMIPYLRELIAIIDHIGDGVSFDEFHIPPRNRKIG